jgi:hypothetical protein
MKFVLLVIISLFLFSCTPNKSSRSGIYINGIYKNVELKYKIGKLPKNWKQLDVDYLNLVFYNKKNNAIIYVNGKCKNSSDAPLTILRTHLLMGFKGKKIIKSEPLKIENREGLHTILITSLDGVKRKVDYYIFKKNGCLYDFVLISKIDDFYENQKRFNKVIKNFKIIKGSNLKDFVE